jgi:ankyrin repeat protein
VLDGLDNDHATAMHAAAYFGHAEVLQVLLAAGAASELVNSDGFTPLHFATSAKHPDAVAVLLQGGANTSVCAQPLQADCCWSAGLTLSCMCLRVG